MWHPKELYCYRVEIDVSLALPGEQPTEDRDQAYFTMSIQMTISTMSGLRSRKELTFRMEHSERPAASALDNLFM